MINLIPRFVLLQRPHIIMTPRLRRLRRASRLDLRVKINVCLCGRVHVTRGMYTRDRCNRRNERAARRARLSPVSFYSTRGASGININDDIGPTEIGGALLFAKQNEINKTAVPGAASLRIRASHLRRPRMCHIILCVCDQPAAA